MRVKAVLFDLDGVLVSTDECHFKAWSRLAAEEGIPFTRAQNDLLRGVSREESLEILLRGAQKTYSAEQKAALAARKNEYYRALIEELTQADAIAGARETLALCKQLGLKAAVASSSKNTRLILQKTGLAEEFCAVADGNCIRKSKPDPEVFLKAAQLAGEEPAACLVVEDAEAGVTGGKRGGMRVLAVGAAQSCPYADHRAASLADPCVAPLLRRLAEQEEEQ